MSRRPSLLRCLLIALLVHGFAVWLLSLSDRTTVDGPPVASMTVPSAYDAVMLEVVYERSARQRLKPAMSAVAQGKRSGQASNRAIVPYVHASKQTDAPVNELPPQVAEQRQEARTEPMDASTMDDRALQDGVPQEQATSRGPLSLDEMGIGIGQSSALVLGDELRGSGEESSVQNRLDKELAKGLLERDPMLSSTIDGALRRTIEGAVRGVLVHPTHALLNIQLTPEGELAEVALLESASESAELRALAERLRGQRISYRGPRSLAFTFRVNYGPRLPSGRSPLTRVSVGGIRTNKGGVADSPHVEVLPPRIRLTKPLVLDSAASGGSTKPANLPAYVELRVLDLDFDPIDLAGTEQHVLQVRLVRRKVL